MGLIKFVIVTAISNVFFQNAMKPWIYYGNTQLPVFGANESMLPEEMELMEPSKSDITLATSAINVLENLTTSAETVVFDVSGQQMYLFQDGAIYTASASGENYELYAECGGRPLAGKLDASGNIIYADAVRGLMMVEATTKRAVALGDRVSASSAVDPSSPIMFADDIDIASDGIVYFSDAAKISPGERQQNGNYDVLKASKASFLQGPTGRLLSYSPSTGAIHVLATGLWFANGVALSEDESFVVVASTMSARLFRYWLTGPMKGQLESFAQLPGLPDGVSLASDGGFWVAGFSETTTAMLLLAKHVHARWIAGWLPPRLLPRENPSGMVVKLNKDGEILYVLRDPTGAKVKGVTSVTEHAERIYLGSLKSTNLASLDLQVLEGRSAHEPAAEAEDARAHAPPEAESTGEQPDGDIKAEL